MPDGMERKARSGRILQEIANAREWAATDRQNRENRLEKVEECETQARGVVVYVCRMERQMAVDDVIPFASVLKSVGQTEDLDLIIHSPGGDGHAAEKFLDLCRKTCTGALRVVEPLFAKSAATLIALGADEILMGETSELGPIDAQVFIIQDNQPQQVSADHFLRAKEEALKALASGNQAEILAAQIQLAQLSAAFLQQCGDLMNFAKDLAKKQLCSNMFKYE